MSVEALPCSVVSQLWPEERTILGLQTSKGLRDSLQRSKKSVLCRMRPEAILGSRLLPRHMMGPQIQRHRLSMGKGLARFTRFGMPVKLIWKTSHVEDKFRKRSLSTSNLLHGVIFVAFTQVNRKLSLRSLFLEEPSWGEDRVLAAMLLVALRDWTKVRTLEFHGICLREWGGCGLTDILPTLPLKQLYLDLDKCQHCPSTRVAAKMLDTVPEVHLHKVRGAAGLRDILRHADSVACRALTVSSFPTRNSPARDCEDLYWTMEGRQYPNLERLTLKGGGLLLQMESESLARAFSSMTALRRLDLSRNRMFPRSVDGPGLASVLEALAALPNLEELDLSFCGVNEQVASELELHLRHSKSLQRLRLEGTDYEALCMLPADFAIATPGRRCAVLPPFVQLPAVSTGTKVCLDRETGGLEMRGYLGHVKDQVQPVRLQYDDQGRRWALI